MRLDLSRKACLVALLACNAARSPDELHFVHDGVEVTVRHVDDDAGVHLRIRAEAPQMIGVRDHVVLVMRRADGGVALRSESITGEETIPDASAPLYAPYHLETVTHETLESDVTIHR